MPLVRTPLAVARRDAFRSLLAEYEVSEEEYDRGEEEDPRPFVAGRSRCSQFVCVTLNYSSRGGPMPFFLPTFDSLADAQRRAVEFAADDVFEELPVEVRDLDSGESWGPDWSTLGWSKGWRGRST